MTRTSHPSEGHGRKPASFHRFRTEAQQAPREQYLYVAPMRASTGEDAPDLPAVIDAAGVGRGTRWSLC